MEVKKASSLSMLFLRYLMGFCLLLLLLVFAVLAGFYYAMNTGLLLSANHAERALQSSESQLAASQPFDSSQVPYPCSYALFDNKNILVQTDMSEKAITKLKNTLAAKEELPQNQYRRILREDGSVLIVEFDIRVHFADPELNKRIPNPELAELIFLFLCFLLFAVLIALKFSKRLKLELAPLTKATDAIRQKNLDFEIFPTHIRELNTVLQSIDDLKSALSASLKEQWNMEQSKNFQLSAIAHDLKTPLTVIKGNTELLLESSVQAEDKELLQYIGSSADKIENYTRLLISAASLSEENENTNQLFSFPELVNELEKQGMALCKTKSIDFVLQAKDMPADFTGDRFLISSAVINLLNNAVEHSREGTLITLEITGGTEGYLSFTVDDRGSGFSAEALKNADKQFYTEQSARSGKHYGLGLYIAKITAEKHGGRLIIANREDGPGASVTLELHRIVFDNKYVHLK